MDQAIRRQQGQPVSDSLANQHAIKWIIVQRWQPRHGTCRALFQRKGQDVVTQSFGRYVNMWRDGERKFTKPIFDADLPRRNGTKIDRILWINEKAPRDRGQLWGIPDYPQKCAGIEQNVMRHTLLVFSAKRRQKLLGQLIEEACRQRLPVVLCQANRPGACRGFGRQ